jgi:hypothetical protein
VDKNQPSTRWHFTKVVHSTLRVPTRPDLLMAGLTVEHARQALEVENQEVFEELLDEFSDDVPAQPWQVMSIDLT